MPKQQKPSPLPPKPEHNLEDLLEEWQFRLRLQDWDITAIWAPHGRVDAFGRTRTNLSSRVAMIDVVPPEQLDNPCATDDPEVTLVHEMLHVKAADAVETDDDVCRLLNHSPLWECFIEQVAQALVAAKRGEVRI